MIADTPACEQRPLSCKVHVIIASVLSMTKVLKVEGLGFTVSYAYGMTEVLGPAIVRPWRPDQWYSCVSKEHKMDKYQEELNNLVIEEADVKEPDTMKVYHMMEKQLERTRDLGVIHPNGFIQLKDRAKDIIVSGGEIISTLKVEAVLLSHPKVLEAAVVGKHDDDLKEKPCAFVKLKEGYGAISCEDIVNFARNNCQIIWFLEL
ncbi:hypothetical protein REPUB_Repub10bG0185700 [Reevesia pubescens]